MELADSKGIISSAFKLFKTKQETYELPRFC